MNVSELSSRCIGSLARARHVFLVAESKPPTHCMLMPLIFEPASLALLLIFVPTVWNAT